MGIQVGDIVGTHEFLGLALELDLDVGLAALVGDLEGKVLDVGLDFDIIELATDQSFCVKDTREMMSVLDKVDESDRHTC